MKPTQTTEAGIRYDKQDQMDKVVSGLLPGETLYAVYDCTGIGTGFVGITDRRVIIQDNSFVGKHNALISVPFRLITAVGYVGNKSMFGPAASASSIAIAVGGRDFVADFRGEGKAQHIHNHVLTHIL